MDNEQLTEAIINLLKKINRTEALELIYELAKRLQDQAIKLSPFCLSFSEQSFQEAPIRYHPIRKEH